MLDSPSKSAIISFIPAIHKGYIDFFQKYPGTLFILGKDFVKDFPHIERDLRTPVFSDLKKIIDSLEIFDQVIELTRKTISEIPKDLKIIMADDEIHRKVAEKYLNDNKVEFKSIFLRWNKQISKQELEVSPNRMISENDRDREFIKEAEELAKNSPDWWRRIGAVAVQNNKVILGTNNSRLPSSFNMDTYGDPRSNFDAGESFELVTSIHAEANIVATAARKGISLEGASLYVTTFPCPVCAKLLGKAGIKKVYYSKGYSLLDAEGVLKASGVEIILVK